MESIYHSKYFEDESDDESPFIESNKIIKSGGANKINDTNDSNTKKIPQIDKLFTNSECSVHIEPNNNVCSPPDVVKEISKVLKTQNDDPEQIISEAKEKTKCDSESCVLKNLNFPKQVLNEYFNVEGPHDSTEWLSNYNIDKTLEKYVLKYNSDGKKVFHHITYHMMDFYETNSELANLDINHISQFDFVGCVLNTDVSTGPGQHWVVFFLDNKNKTIEYFDSAGAPATPEVQRLQVDLADKFNQKNMKYKKIQVTSLVHQKKNTECGVYSLFYIISRLSGIPYTFFEHTRVPDEKMEEFRKSLFRHS